MFVYRLSILIRSAGGYVMRVGRGVDSPGQAQAIAEAGWGQDLIDGSTTRYTLRTWRPEETQAVLVSTQELQQRDYDDGEPVFYGEGSGWTGYSTGE